ncbi:MAG: acetylglutamate kinase [Phycisphaerae bacterium]|nr:acetylglutamate kinase [Phycisphaerae bacterium]
MPELTSRSTKSVPASTAHAGPLVVKVGGALLDDPDANRPVVDALADLASDAAGGLVLVHGGGVLVDRHLARLGVTTERIEGIRVTPPDVVEEIVGVLAGRVNARLVGMLQAADRGVRCVGLSLTDGGLCACRKATTYTFDPGAVGEVHGGDPRLVTTLLAAGFTPVISSIGHDERGGFLNINADDAAAAIAGIVHARELVLLTDVPGVLDQSGAVIPSLGRADIERLIADGTIKGGMIAKVRGALAAAVTAGVPVTIASWKNPASIRNAETCTRVRSEE